MSQIEFIPTPEQIAVACAEIQATWSDTDRRLRRRGVDMALPAGGKQAEAAARLAVEMRLERQRAGDRLKKQIA